MVRNSRRLGPRSQSNNSSGVFGLFASRVITQVLKHCARS
jgi:hypothetical protein